ncbi:hypothetical protein LX64_01957 [Chitinophaga skermanii]|uniref:Tetratricopeptide repeat protein n=1 Tax=Chitinophaga skermanii TaxID=331697 RepID=A0A327QR82_9BACT|nr:hypothetical protein [Chitinophaga skermanii]RAJ06830.1 hypothetical protein LX64_01957 [Chitinophaga skermanii]
MKATLRLFLCLSLVAFLAACKSGQKLYQKGRYDEAVASFVKKLQRKPGDATALAYIPKAYAEARDMGEYNVNRILTSNDPFKWEAVKNEYRQLQYLYDLIQSSPAAKSVVQATDYTRDIANATNNGAQVRYDRGLAFMDKNTKQSYKQAYNEFIAALQLVPNFKDAKELRDEAYQLAIVTVVVSQIDIRSPMYQLSADFFRDELVRGLQQRNIDPFVRFLDERAADRDHIRGDHYLRMRFYDFQIGQALIERFERQVQKENVVIGTINVRDSTGKVTKQNQYGTVKATLYITKKTILSQALFDYEIIDIRNNAVITNNRIPGRFTWLNQFGTFKGDERALSDDDKRLMGGADVAPPAPQALFLEVTRPIYDQLGRDLQSFYSRY